MALTFSLRSRAGAAKIEQHLIIERVFQTMILRNLAVASNLGSSLWLIQNRRVVQALRLPMFHGAAHFEPVRAADHFVDRAKAQLGHMLAHFLRDEAHEVHHVRGIAGKFFAQLGVLRGHADRASVEMANPHHDAAERHQRRRRKAEFFRAEQRGNDHVAPGLELAVGFHGDAAAQIIEHERLMRFRQAQAPKADRRA